MRRHGAERPEVQAAGLRVVDEVPCLCRGGEAISTVAIQVQDRQGHAPTHSNALERILRELAEPGVVVVVGQVGLFINSEAPKVCLCRAVDVGVVRCGDRR